MNWKVELHCPLSLPYSNMRILHGLGEITNDYVIKCTRNGKLKIIVNGLFNHLHVEFKANMKFNIKERAYIHVQNSVDWYETIFHILMFVGSL